jgi:serine O-acetyltransferase
MDQKFINNLFQAHHACPTCPAPTNVVDFFIELIGTIFPDFSKKQFNSIEQLESHLLVLQEQLTQMLSGKPNFDRLKASETAKSFFKALPNLVKELNQDAQAIFEGDPAAKSLGEVIRSYPGFYAVAAYRIAHALHKSGVLIIPRMITEHAHSKTGIDIHPGSKIGSHFCIDHGTGIVIGETTVIGNHVKLYQGVTLGALSVNKADAEKKRHPTIQDHVVIYAGATILGGETTIGHDSIIGGNVWITKSIEPHTKIYYQAKLHNKKTDETELVVYRAHV